MMVANRGTPATDLTREVDDAMFKLLGVRKLDGINAKKLTILMEKKLGKVPADGSVVEDEIELTGYLQLLNYTAALVLPPAQKLLENLVPMGQVDETHVDVLRLTVSNILTQIRDELQHHDPFDVKDKYIIDTMFKRVGLPSDEKLNGGLPPAGCLLRQLWDALEYGGSPHSVTKMIFNKDQEQILTDWYKMVDLLNTLHSAWAKYDLNTKIPFKDERLMLGMRINRLLGILTRLGELMAEFMDENQDKDTFVVLPQLDRQDMLAWLNSDDPGDGKHEHKSPSPKNDSETNLNDVISAVEDVVAKGHEYLEQSGAIGAFLLDVLCDEAISEVEQAFEDVPFESTSGRKKLDEILDELKDVKSSVEDIAGMIDYDNCPTIPDSETQS